MNVHISYKISKTSDIEQEIQHNIDKMRRRLQVFRPELVHLHGILEENSPREGFVISLNLRLPSGQMVARASATNATAAIKNAFDNLTEELVQHKDRLRSQHKSLRRRGHHPELQQAQPVGRLREEPEVPFERTFAALQPTRVNGADVSQYINVNLRRLERFVERELRYRRNSEQLPHDLVTREEVVDEVVASALGDEQEKPPLLGLEPWLYRLALRSIDAVARRNREDPEMVSLDSSARPQNVRGNNEPQLQYHQPDEMMTRGDVIDSHASTPEQIAASDEMITQVEAALDGATHEERDAFILFAIEGFTVEEIAAIGDRKLEEVRGSITAARDRLKKTVGAAKVFRDKLLQHSRSA